MLLLPYSPNFFILLQFFVDLWFGTCDAGTLTDKQCNVIIVSVFNYIMIVVIVLLLKSLCILNDCLIILCSLYCKK